MLPENKKERKKEEKVKLIDQPRQIRRHNLEMLLKEC